LPKVKLPTTLLVFIGLSLLAALSLKIIRSEILASTFIRLLGFLAFFILIYHRFLLERLGILNKMIANVIELTPIILFTWLLVLSTGGLSSPFLVLTHILALGLGFLFNPTLAVTFITATIALFVTHLILDPAGRVIWQESPTATILYFLAFLAVFPFSYLLAKYYKVKEEWVRILEKQIATSKNQEEELLKNITDAVFVIDRQSKLAYLNQAAMKFSKYGNEILEQDFFKFFSFKDKEGRNLEPYSLPFEQTLTSKVQTILENIQIAAKEKKYQHVDMKILPAIAPEGPLGLILIVEDRSAKEEVKTKKESLTQAALSRFLSLLDKQKNVFTNLEISLSTKEKIKDLTRQNEELEHLAQDFIYALRLESGEIGALTNLVDIGKITQEVIDASRIRAKELGIILTIPQISKPQVTLPKTGLKIPQEKKVFPVVYALGNFIWIKDSLKRIMELAMLLCQKNKEVTIEVAREENLAKVRITSINNNVTTDLANQLFEKFYGGPGFLPELSQTSGLEGYIAKNLIERMGGNISVESQKNPALLIFTITFGVKEKIQVAA